MKTFSKLLLVGIVALTTTAVMADVAKSDKHAKKATELRQSVFSLLGSNMGPLGAMAKGKIALDATTVEKNAVRINQLSMMIADYTRTDTSSFDVKTSAKDAMWKDKEEFSNSIDKLTMASTALIAAAQSKDEGAIKKAIGGVGKSCGGCHDNFKED